MFKKHCLFLEIRFTSWQQWTNQMLWQEKKKKKNLHHPIIYLGRMNRSGGLSVCFTLSTCPPAHTLSVHPLASTKLGGHTVCHCSFVFQCSTLINTVWEHFIYCTVFSWFHFPTIHEYQTSCTNDRANNLGIHLFVSSWKN